MIKLKEAMKKYFEKLNEVYKKEANTYPCYPWSETDSQSLYVSKPDEDGYAEWQPLEIKTINLIQKEKLSHEMVEFYSSYYYWCMEGCYDKINFDFGASNTEEVINQNINNAILNGKYYFPNNDYLLIGSACSNGNDDLLVFYNQENENVFIYDQDKKEIWEKTYSLGEIISEMEPYV